MRPVAPQPFGVKPHEPYADRRADGWPLCPQCGEDELYSLEVPATVKSICGCYRCNWRPICRHCSRPYSEHGDKPGRMVPRTECLGMREGFEVKR